MQNCPAKTKLVLVFISLLVQSHQLLAQDPYAVIFPNGSDPTEIRSRLDLNFLNVTGLSDKNLAGVSLAGTCAIHKKCSIGLSLPLTYSDFSGWIEGGLGDITLETRYRFSEPKPYTNRTAAVGAELLVKTGDYDRGTGFGQNIIAPYFTLAFHADEEFLFAPIVRYYVGFHPDAGVQQRNELRLQLRSVISYPSGFWTTLQPEAIFDFTGIRQPSYPMRAEFGKMFGARWGFSAGMTIYLAGEPRTKYIGSLSVRYLFER